MNIEKLQKQLIAEGCNWFYIPPFRHEYVSMAETVGVDVLENIHGIWTVYFTERGNRNPPIYESINEAEACQFYLKRITAFEHRHSVGLYEDEVNALDLQERLSKIPVSTAKGVGLPRKDGGPRLHYVSVVGKDIFKVRELYSELPLKDYE